MKTTLSVFLFLFSFVLGAQSQTLTGVQVTPYGSVIQSGTLQFTPNCQYSNGTTDTCSGKTVTWYSSVPAEVTVNSSGLATFVSNCGTNQWECWVHIVATVGGFHDYATIMLQFAGCSSCGSGGTALPQDTFEPIIALQPFNNPDRASTAVVGSVITFGAGAGINEGIERGNANPFPGCNWTSSAPSIATVDRYGFVTAVSPGTSTITCVPAGNGVYSTSTWTTVLPAAQSITVIAGSAGTTTWYVRQDGGLPYTNATDTPAGQCDGKHDAAYPGTGVNQPCAFGDFEYLYFDQVTGKRQWVITGGDTVIVEPKAAGYNTAVTSTSTPTNCNGDFQSCDVPQIPPGSTGHPTRILGSNYATCTGDHAPDPTKTTLLLGWGREMIRTDISQFIDVECFELMPHDASHGATEGVVLSAFTSQATFKNLFIHGMSGFGEFGATGVGVVWDHNRIRAAGATGFNMDGTPYEIGNISVAGGLSMTDSLIEFTGCPEIWGSTAEYPYAAGTCIDENEEGGQGDGFGTGSMAGTWLFDHDIFRYNFQDGLDSLHSGAQSETITNSQSYGNDGQQFKFGDVENGVFQKNFSLGNCGRILQPFNGVSIASVGVNPCRAGGAVLLTQWANTGSYVFQNNTMLDIGLGIFSYACEVTWADCSGASTVLQNNILGGYTDTATWYNSGGLSDAFGVNTGSPIPPNDGYAVRSNNFFFNLANYTLGTSEQTIDPKFINEPPFQTPLVGTGETVLDNYNFFPSSISPLIGAGVAVGLATDANGVASTTPPVIGALNFVLPTAGPIVSMQGKFSISGRARLN